MPSLVHDLHAGAGARPRTLIANSEAVWIWPGIALTSRRGDEIVAESRETIHFWITRWHGPEALYTDAVHCIEDAARALTLGNQKAAQRALDAIGLEYLSRDGAMLMHRVAGRLGLEVLDLIPRAGPRLWTARDIDLQVPFAAEKFDRAAPLAKFVFDPLKHPRRDAGTPEGGQFRSKDSDAVVVPAASSGDKKGGPPKGRTQGGQKPKPNVPTWNKRPPITVYQNPPTSLSPDNGLSPYVGDAQPGTPKPAPIEPGIGHNGGPPLGEPPELPTVELPDKLRNLFVKGAVRWIVRAIALAAYPEIAPYLTAMVAGEWLARACWPYIKAYFDPPKTLEELQRDALTPQKGYDIHHFVEKDQADKDGIPESVWDGPENRVRVPTLKHWLITGWYMTKNKKYDGLSPRNYLKGKSWEEKVRVGREALIEFGVLKP